jgi:ABC-type Fe3+/spermidine/putrescine transport system ATPase subunit
MVEAHGARLAALAARERPEHERVLLLLRPEAIAAELRGEGGTPLDGGLQGTIASHIFLGSVTRLYVTTAVGELMVDIGSLRALSLPDGSSVTLSWKPEAPRIISLAGENGHAAPAQVAGIGASA